jgi:hypothetical protein
MKTNPHQIRSEKPPVIIQKIHQWCSQETIYSLIALLCLSLKYHTSLDTQQLLFKFDIHPNIISEIETGDWTYRQIIGFLTQDFSSYE